MKILGNKLSSLRRNLRLVAIVGTSCLLTAPIVTAGIIDYFASQAASIQSLYPGSISYGDALLQLSAVSADCTSAVGICRQTAIVNEALRDSACTEMYHFAGKWVNGVYYPAWNEFSPEQTETYNTLYEMCQADNAAQYASDLAYCGDYSECHFTLSE